MNRYSSVVLWYQEQMGQGNGEPFAAVVERHDDDRVEVFCVWKYIDTADAITKETIDRFPDVLGGYVREAIERGARVVDVLASRLRWNVYASPPENKLVWWRSSLPEYGFQVFAAHVDVDEESLRSIRTQDRQTKQGSFTHIVEEFAMA